MVVFKLASDTKQERGGGGGGEGESEKMSDYILAKLTKLTKHFFFINGFIYIYINGNRYNADGSLAEL